MELFNLATYLYITTNIMIKQYPTPTEINEAYAFAYRYMKFHGLDEDDVQDVIFKFARYYDNTNTASPNSFTNMLMKQRKADKYFRIAEKRMVTTIHIDGFEADDTLALMADNTSYQPMEREEEDMLLKERISSLMDDLTTDQRIAFEYLYIEGLSLEDTSIEMGRSYKAVCQLKISGIKRLKNRYNE